MKNFTLKEIEIYEIKVKTGSYLLFISFITLRENIFIVVKDIKIYLVFNLYRDSLLSRFLF